MKDLFDNMQNIVPICSSITIALLGLAYPIILNNISNIGEKYNSKYLLVVFNYESIQKKIICESNLFQLTLYLSLFSLVFQIFQFKPLFDWDNWFINNSADIFTIFSTLLLVVIFFKWIQKIRIYIGGIDVLFKYLTSKYEKGTIRQKQYCFKTINEIAIYSIKKGDVRLEKDLLEFYTEILIKYRNEYGK